VDLAKPPVFSAKPPVVSPKPCVVLFFCFWFYQHFGMLVLFFEFNYFFIVFVEEWQ
jgi:hypothetical protein